MIPKVVILIPISSNSYGVTYDFTITTPPGTARRSTELPSVAAGQASYEIENSADSDGFWFMKNHLRTVLEYSQTQNISD